MSSSSQFDSSFEAFREQNKPKYRLGLTDRFCEVSHFLLRLRVQLLYGKLSRAPLKLLRLQLLSDVVEFECLARAGDPWDVDLPDWLARRHVTLQVVRDAIDLRALLFRTMPEAKAAHIRIYRELESGKRELIMVGRMHRNDQCARGVHSLTVRARILGYRFKVEDELLGAISDEGYSLSSLTDVEA